MSEFKKKLNEAQNWIYKFKEGKDSFHTIYRTYDEFNKFNSLLDQIPASSADLKTNLESKLFEPLCNFVDSLGPSLEVNKDDLSFSGASASSASVLVLNEIQSYSSIDYKWLPKFSFDAFKLIQDIQKEKKSIEFIKSMLNELHLPLGKEFSELIELHIGYTASIEYASSFGIKMRNVLEHFRGVCSKGAIIQRYGYFKELKESLSWNKISEYVAKGGKNSKYDNEFSKNSSIYTDIWKSLSKDAKDYEVADIEKLPKTFAKIIQYLESSINFIDLEKIKDAL